MRSIKFISDWAQCLLKTARAELDKVYHQITERIDALVIVEGLETYEAFVRTLNAVIAKYEVKHHKHHRSLSEAEGSGSEGSNNSATGEQHE